MKQINDFYHQTSSALLNSEYSHLFLAIYLRTFLHMVNMYTVILINKIIDIASYCSSNKAMYCLVCVFCFIRVW